jgi:hypothetical protein
MLVFKKYSIILYNIPAVSSHEVSMPRMNFVENLLSPNNVSGFKIIFLEPIIINMGLFLEKVYIY